MKSEQTNGSTCSRKYNDVPPPNCSVTDFFFFQVLGNIPCEHPEALGFLFLSGISRRHARVISIPHPTCWLAS